MQNTGFFIDTFLCQCRKYNLQDAFINGKLHDINNLHMTANCCHLIGVKLVNAAKVEKFNRAISAYWLSFSFLDDGVGLPMFINNLFWKMLSTPKSIARGKISLDF